MIIESARLQLTEFTMADAVDVYSCITPVVTRYMSWEPPQSYAEYEVGRKARLESDDQTGLAFVIRRRDTRECLGCAGLHEIDQPSSGLGIWLKEAAQGNRYGTEVIRGLITWAFETLGKEHFTYTVASENLPSRRIAESLGGVIVGSEASSKFDAIIYRIDWKP